VLETERLRLRPVVADDVDAFERIFGDAEVMRFVAYGRPYAHEEIVALVERILQRFEADGFGQLAVELQSDGQVIGRAGLLPLDPATWQSGSRTEIGETAEIELGWTLAREAWGRGYATEAAAAARDWAFGELAMTRLVSIIQHGNDRSVRVAEKLGARRERKIVTSFGKAAWLYALRR
jgi:RimJ/RimL family protein N-acetyltransferase